MKAALQLVRPEKSGRMRKLECTCGLIIRTTDKWIKAGAPACACGGDLRLEDGTVLPGRVEAPARPAGAPELSNPTHHRRAHLHRALAAIAGGFIPAASYVVAHIEAQDNNYLYGLVAAALLFSAPTLAAWAQRWCDGAVKAWGFVVLLEGVMILSQIPYLNLVGLGILVCINSAYAWERAKGTA